MARRSNLKDQGDDVGYHYDDDHEEDEVEDEDEMRARRFDQLDDQDEEQSDYSSAPETSNSMNARDR